jgi:O-antigen/teichoic acid export membrane protein
MNRLYFKKNIRTASSGSVIIKFGGVFFAFLNGILLARQLSLEGFGYYILAFSTITVLSVPANLGLPSLITRYLSKYEVSKDYASIKGLLLKTNQTVFISILSIYVVAGALYWFWWGSFQPVLVDTLLYAFLLLPIIAVNALLSATLRGMKLIIISELSDTFFRNFVVFICISAFILSGYEITPQRAIIFQVAGALLGSLVALKFLYSHLLRKLRTITPLYQKREWFKQAIPFSINSGIQVVKTKLLLYVLAVFGTIEAVAIFEVALRGANLVSFTLDALNRAIAPYISSTFEKGNMETLQRIIKKTGRIIFISSLPVAVLFIVGGSNLIEWIFGENYGTSYIPLVILCIGQLVSALVGPVGLLLNMTGRQAVFSKSNVVALLTNIILGIVLVIYYDVIGAAIIYALVVIIQNFYLLFYAKRHLKINTSVF